MLTMLIHTLLFILGAAALPSPYAHFHSQAHVNESSLTVDLGYARYQGWLNESANLVIFQGQVRTRLKFTEPGKCHGNTLTRCTYSIRYAQSTTGKLRWQAPRAPEADQEPLLQADSWPAQCPQSPGATSSQSYTFVNNSGSSEDCLFVNVGMPFPTNRCARC